MTQGTMRRVYVLAACAGLQLAGCAAEDDTQSDEDVLAQHAGQQASLDAGTPSHTPADAAATDAGAGGHTMPMGDGGGYPEAKCDARYPQYTPGLTQKFGDLTVQVVSAAPAPPRQKVPNDWVLKISDAAGPLVGAKLLNADTFMSVHGHSGAFVPTVVQLTEPGQWKLDDLDFSMRGPWEITFDVQPQGAARPQRISFNVCVE